MRCDEEKRRMGTSVSQLSSPKINRSPVLSAPGRRRGGGGGQRGRQQASKIKGRGRRFRVFKRRGGGFHGPNYFTKGPS